MQFWSVCADLVPEDIMGGLKHGPLTAKPRFLLYLDGEKKEEISGADLTTLEAAIARYIPQSDD